MNIIEAKLNKNNEVYWMRHKEMIEVVKQMQLTNEEIAAKVGCSHSMVNMVLNEKTQMSVGMIMKWVNGLQLKL